MHSCSRIRRRRASSGSSPTSAHARRVDGRQPLHPGRDRERRSDRRLHRRAVTCSEPGDRRGPNLACRSPRSLAVGARPRRAALRMFTPNAASRVRRAAPERHHRRAHPRRLRCRTSGGWSPVGARPIISLPVQVAPTSMPVAPERAAITTWSTVTKVQYAACCRDGARCQIRASSNAQRTAAERVLEAPVEDAEWRVRQRSSGNARLSAAERIIEAPNAAPVRAQ
jgi:hypothetical protein